MDSQRLAEAVILIALFVIVAGPVHECAHAFTAWRLGDGTARAYGRVSLDPIVHFDPLGGSLLILSVLLSGFGFGWAKPTPVNPNFLRGRYAGAMVAAAGPLSNLAVAALFAVGFRVLWAQGVEPSNESAINMLQLVFEMGVILNVVLLLFNLIPVAPLDGSHVLLAVLDYRTARRVEEFMTQSGIFLLVAVVLLAGTIMRPILGPLVSFLLGVPIEFI